MTCDSYFSADVTQAACQGSYLWYNLYPLTAGALRASRQVWESHARVCIKHEWHSEAVTLWHSEVVRNSAETCQGKTNTTLVWIPQGRYIWPAPVLFWDPCLRFLSDPVFFFFFLLLQTRFMQDRGFNVKISTAISFVFISFYRCGPGH